MQTYRTAQVAKMIGIHPNTVRLYEELGLVPRARRLANGYRVFTEQHIAQFRLARLAFRVEVLQNGLRKKIVRTVKTAAAGDFDAAIRLTDDYIAQVRQERQNAEEAIRIVRLLLAGEPAESGALQNRQAVSRALGISVDTLRNWEMNGLLTVKRRENGFRVYTGEDIRRLKIIRSLRCANYSLEAILRLLHELSSDPHTDIHAALNTPRADDDIIAVCDKLLLSLQAAEQNARAMRNLLREMKSQYS